MITIQIENSVVLEIFLRNAERRFGRGIRTKRKSEVIFINNVDKVHAFIRNYFKWQEVSYSLKLQF